MVTQEDKQILHSLTSSSLCKQLLYYCEKGKINYIDYIFSHPQLSKMALPIMTKALECACCSSQLNTLRYLLLSSHLKQYHDWEDAQRSIFNKLLFFACRADNVNIVDFLLNSPLLVKNANIHYDNDKHFIHAFLMSSTLKKSNILNYLIFNFNIKKTPYIENYLLEKNGQDILNLFNKRDMKNRLQANLLDDHILKKRLKI